MTSDKEIEAHLEYLYQSSCERDDSVEQCCSAQRLSHTGSGYNEVEGWGCYQCSGCGAEFQCFFMRYKIWERVK